jgi:hypothetical protein
MKTKYCTSAIGNKTTTSFAHLLTAVRSVLPISVKGFFPKKNSARKSTGTSYGNGQYCHWPEILECNNSANGAGTLTNKKTPSIV